MEPNPNFEMLFAVLEQVYDYDKTWKDNLEVLSLRLSKLSGRKTPWGWKYLNSLLRGYQNFSISKEMNRALIMLASQLDGGSPLKPLIREITMYTVNGLDEYAIVLGHSKRCEGCAVLFVPNVPWRRFCCDECREDYSKLYIGDQRKP